MKPNFFILAYLCTFSILSAQPDPLINMAESLVPNVVRLEVKLADGSSQNGFGFVTQEDNGILYIITAAHVTHGQYGKEKFISEPERITVSFSNSLEKKTAREVTWFEAEDLALLQLEKPAAFSWRSPFVATSVAAYNNVSFIGRNDRFTVLKGGYIFEIANDKLFFTPSFILPGTSGAPLINSTGVVGMITDDSAEEATALSIERIQELLKMANGESPYFFDIDNYVKIAGGSFDMGDQFNEGQDDEKPVHTVRLSRFRMSPTEVTNEEVAAFLNAKGNQKTENRAWLNSLGLAKFEISGTNFRVKSGYELHPVVGMTWYGAIHFCNWKSEQAGLQRVYSVNGTTVEADWTANGYRLPTEAEWEYAAREGGKRVRFGNGENIARSAEMNFRAAPQQNTSYAESGEQRTGPIAVNTLKKNRLGLYHMSGNVAEWCWDTYGESYYESERNISDPKGPSGGSGRVIRGGLFNAPAGSCRATDRFWDHPVPNGYGYSHVGFRLVRN